MTSADDDLSRYSRQVRFAPIGEAGQHRLASARALICGCGALGSVIADMLVRAGVGTVRIVDRDFLELNNLQRQTLYDEEDLRANLPKAIAAANKLRRINSAVTVEPVVADIDHTNIESLCAGVDCILDGTDNFETRFLINDAALKLGIPWVYGGCLGATGQSMTILPGTPPCLRCLMPELPEPGSTPTCDTAGVLAPIVGVIGSIEACEAIKVLSANVSAVSQCLAVFDLWENRLRHVQLAPLAARSDCPACGRREFTYLAGRGGSRSAVLCGRNAVQVTPARRERLLLETLAAKLASVGRVSHNAFLLRLTVDRYILTVFPDGRAIVGGTDDIATARTLYAKYIGA